jgi:formamidopyrimidine-DNA glycosylase
MPELPEVEVLVRHLNPLLRGKTIQAVRVQRARTIAPDRASNFARQLRGATFAGVTRRAKYLVFAFRQRRGKKSPILVGHLGMTGRMYLQPAKSELPKHAPVVLELGRQHFVFEDTRYFGRLMLSDARLKELGPEPLSDDFVLAEFATELKRSRQSIKVKLLDQTLVAGIGNIYASEALFRAGISPRLAAARLRPAQVERLWHAIREVLHEAIEGGSTVPLNHSGNGQRDGLFYFGSAPHAENRYEERLRVYDRAGQPCVTCGAEIKRLVQAARSTFYCGKCQR